ncbi:MAG TPA: hypothetical protein VL119_05055, partial [Acidimicrobiia bacterium]|nr:hypothetical protein [Acidimicrobiia bacterium]
MTAIAPAPRDARPKIGPASPPPVNGREPVVSDVTVDVVVAPATIVLEVAVMPSVLMVVGSEVVVAAIVVDVAGAAVVDVVGASVVVVVGASVVVVVVVGASVVVVVVGASVV